MEVRVPGVARAPTGLSELWMSHRRKAQRPERAQRRGEPGGWTRLAAGVGRAA